MKKLLTYLTAVLLVFSCDDDNGTNNRCSEVPCDSSFRCEVNSVSWEARKTYAWCDPFSSYYYPQGTAQLDSGYLSFSAENCIDSSWINFVIKGVFEPGTYLLTDSLVFASFTDAKGFKNTGFPEAYDSIISGGIQITRIQPDNFDNTSSKWGRVQGTFDFVAISDSGNVVNIANGAFDMVLP